MKKLLCAWVVCQFLFGISCAKLKKPKSQRLDPQVQVERLNLCIDGYILSEFDYKSLVEDAKQKVTLPLVFATSGITFALFRRFGVKSRASRLKDFVGSVACGVAAFYGFSLQGNSIMVHAYPSLKRRYHGLCRAKAQVVGNLKAKIDAGQIEPEFVEQAAEWIGGDYIRAAKNLRLISRDHGVAFADVCQEVLSRV